MNLKMNEHKKIINKRISTILFLSLLILLININLSIAQPSPLGVEGTIYHKDSVTEVFVGVPIIIKNLVTNETIKGETGKGSSGRYSFALNWDKGTLIRINASNPYYENTTDLVLNGTIRNVNLNLEMLFENIPPEITSTPSTYTIVEHEYVYEITHFDWNYQDNITYSLVEKPENMTLQGNKISWIPSKEQFGNHTVILNVSDNQSYVLQEFVIELYVIKDNPSIISQPITKIKRNKLYEYELEVLDDEPEYLTYEVFRGPSGMYFNDNVLTLEINETHSGEYIVIIDITDRYGQKIRHIFLLEIEELQTKKKKTSNNNITILEDNIQEITSKNIFEVRSKNFSVTKIILNNNETITLLVGDTNPVKEKVRSINTNAYQYFFIRPNKDINGNVNIVFSVKKSWLNTKGLESVDIILLKHVNNDWIKLETNLIDQNETEYFYESVSEGLSLFAITHNENKTTIKEPIIIKEIISNKLINGRIIILDEDGKELNLTELQVKRLMENININIIADEEIRTELYKIKNNIFYQAIISEELTEVKIELSIQDYNQINKINLTDTLTMHNIKINSTELLELSKLSVLSDLFKETNKTRRTSTTLFVITLFLIFIILIMIMKTTIKKRK